MLAMLGWGSNFIACKIAYRAVSGLTLLFVRYLVALAVLLLVYRNSPHPHLSKREKQTVFLIGAVGYCLAVALQMVGTKLVAASMASIIQTMTPVAMLLFAGPILQEKSSLQQIFGIALSAAGSVIIVSNSSGESSALGILLSFVGMMLWGLTSVVIRKSCHHIDGIWVTIYGTLAAVIVDAPLMLVELAVEGIVAEAVTVELFAAFFWIGAVSTAGANLWWNKALEIQPAADCALFYPLMPLVTGILGLLILGEQLTVRFAIGCVVIAAGVIVAMLGAKGSKTLPESDTSKTENIR